MTEQYKNKKELIITDSSKFPEDFWNYIVNPIVGYYIPKARSETKRDKQLRKQCETEN